MYSRSNLNLSRPAFDFLREHRESGKTINQLGQEVPFLSFFDHETGLIIYDVVRSINAKVALELGFAHGTSALYILQGLCDNGGGNLLSVDPHAKTSFEGVALKNVERAGFSDMHSCIEYGSETVLPQLMIKGHQFDFIFNDSNHMFDQTLLEIYYSQKLLKVGGVMMFDDYAFSSVKTALNFLETNLDYSLHPVHHDPASADSTRNFRVLVKNSNDVREWFHFIPFHVETADQMSSRMKK